MVRSAGGITEVFRDSFLDEFYVVDHHPDRADSQLTTNEFYQQFWESDEEHRFLVYSTKMAQKYKIREWLNKTLADVRGSLTRSESARF